MPIFYVFIKLYFSIIFICFFLSLNSCIHSIKQFTNTNITNDIDIHRISLDFYTYSYKDKSKSVIEVQNRFSVNKSFSLSSPLSYSYLFLHSFLSLTISLSTIMGGGAVFKIIDWNARFCTFVNDCNNLLYL